MYLLPNPRENMMLYESSTSQTSSKKAMDQLFNRTSLCTTEGKAEQDRRTATISVLSILSQFLTRIQCKVALLLVF